MIRTLFRGARQPSLFLSVLLENGQGKDKEGKLISPSDIGDTENKPRWLESLCSTYSTSVQQKPGHESLMRIIHMTAVIRWNEMRDDHL